MLLPIVLTAAALAPAHDAIVREARAATALYASLNRERRAHGLPPLRLDPSLNGAAFDRVIDMARLQYFGHVSPEGITPWDRMKARNCRFSFAGENIALAQSAAQADHALFKSPPHRANSLSENYTRVGIAAMISADGELLVVEDFAG